VGVAAAAVLIAGAGAGASIASAASVSHATNWDIEAGTLGCGIADVHGTALDPGTGAEQTGYWPGLQCSAEDIKPPKGDEAGDPFVQLGQGTAGRARLVEIGDDDLLYNRKDVTLKPGTTWSLDGISCSIAASSISCHNSSGHGFTLSKGHLKTH